MEKPKLTKDYIFDWLLGYVAKDGNFVGNYVTIDLRDEYDENIYNFLINEPKEDLIDLIKHLDYQASPFVYDLLDKSDNENLAKLILFLASGKDLDSMTGYYKRYDDDLTGITNSTFLEHVQHLNLSELKIFMTKLINSELDEDKTYTDSELLKSMGKISK